MTQPLVRKVLSSCTQDTFQKELILDNKDIFWDSWEKNEEKKIDQMFV